MITCGKCWRKVAIEQTAYKAGHVCLDCYQEEKEKRELEKTANKEHTRYLYDTAYLKGWDWRKQGGGRCMEIPPDPWGQGFNAGWAASTGPIKKLSV